MATLEMAFSKKFVPGSRQTWTQDKLPNQTVFVSQIFTVEIFRSILQFVHRIPSDST